MTHLHFSGMDSLTKPHWSFSIYLKFFSIFTDQSVNISLVNKTNDCWGHQLVNVFQSESKEPESFSRLTAIRRPSPSM